jgi:hypothetical protein
MNNNKKLWSGSYKTDPRWKKSDPSEKGNKGTKAFQDLADEFISVVFGEDELERLNKTAGTNRK